jgi:hypothetical protein
MSGADKVESSCARHKMVNAVRKLGVVGYLARKGIHQVAPGEPVGLKIEPDHNPAHRLFSKEQADRVDRVVHYKMGIDVFEAWGTLAFVAWTVGWYHQNFDLCLVCFVIGFVPLCLMLALTVNITVGNLLLREFNL